MVKGGEYYGRTRILKIYDKPLTIRAAFAKGDLLGKGTRTLPVLPDDVKAALPNPNKIVVPPCD